MSSTVDVQPVSSIRVNRLKEGYTWSVQVAATSNSLVDLQEAKGKALALSRELDEELNPRQETAEVPF